MKRQVKQTLCSLAASLMAQVIEDLEERMQQDWDLKLQLWTKEKNELQQISGKSDEELLSPAEADVRQPL